MVVSKGFEPQSPIQEVSSLVLGSLPHHQDYRSCGGSTTSALVPTGASDLPCESSQAGQGKQDGALGFLSCEFHVLF